MNEKTAANFINSLVKNLQVLCHSNLDFSQNIEVIGHLYLNIDSSKKINYIVNEKVCKNGEASTMFVSNSFHAEDKKQKPEPEPSNQDPTEVDNRTNFSKHKRTMSSDVELGQSYGSNLKFQHRFKKHQVPVPNPEHNNSISTAGPLPAKVSRQSYSYDFEPPVTFYHDSAHRNPLLSSPLSNQVQDVDLSRVKHEPGGQTPLSACSYPSLGSAETVSKSGESHFKFSPLHNTGQMTSNEDSLNINEKTAEFYPIGMMSHLKQRSQITTSATTALPSISTLTNSYGSADTSSMQSLMAHNLGYPERHTLSLKDKIDIIKAVESSERPSQKALALQFGVSQPAINRILKKRDIYIAKFENLNENFEMVSNLYSGTIQ
ncbi:uncharacterized protein LOC126816063 isoform X2 [Patella vulgata]|uniref:uncharacterized protein LOC126816063 isoform X2 n=1 Tax=Patella vulgata TaxID=6465 RepID=UPI00217FE1E9|nr:uncharacterized protein LOC126816063 isoform X2 [Patella vulgata]